MRYLAYYPYEAINVHDRIMEFDLDQPFARGLRDMLHAQRREQEGRSRPDNKEAFAVVDDMGNLFFVQFYDFYCWIGKEASPRHDFGQSRFDRDRYATEEAYNSAVHYLKEH